MYDKPIIFSPDMVRAILAGKKTQTRRLVKGWERIVEKHGTFGLYFKEKQNRLHVFNIYETEIAQYPFPWVPGQKLWVRETWLADKEGNPIYLADHSPGDTARIARKYSPKGQWGRSLYMPKKFARIWLEVVSVKADYIACIRPDEILMEGFDPELVDTSHLSEDCHPYEYWSAIESAFFEVVDRVNHKPPGWTQETDPLVWVIEYRKIRKRE